MKHQLEAFGEPVYCAGGPFYVFLDRLDDYETSFPYEHLLSQGYLSSLELIVRL